MSRSHFRLHQPHDPLLAVPFGQSHPPRCGGEVNYQALTYKEEDSQHLTYEHLFDMVSMPPLLPCVFSL